MRRNGLTAVALSILLAMGVTGFATTGMAAGEKGTDYEWSLELDCSECHQKEYASLGLLELADGADEAAEEEGSSGSDDADGADGNAAEAEQDADAQDESAAARTNVTVELSEDELAHLAEVTAYGPMHAASFGLECSTCHDDPEGLATAHKKLNSGKEAKRLKKSVVTSDPCVSCHSIDDLAEASADYKALADGKGTSVNPHDLPLVESHESIQCLDCHMAHSGKPLQEAAMTACLSCHHAGVFECGTCHN